MLKFQVATKEDLKQAASIERKRQIEEERKPRIFNARFRKIGVDKEFLDKQIEEKKQQRDLEQAKESQLDESLIRSSKLAVVLEKQQEEEKRKIHKEIETFRRLHQRPEDRREFDLYDPEGLKKSLPSRIGDDDPRLGLASVQKFEGEDHSMKLRRKIQKEQTLWWILKQKEERAQAEKEHQSVEKALEEAVISMDKRAITLEHMEQECRRRLNEATAKFNRALAEENGHRRYCEALQEEEDKKAEIYNHVNGDFLTEAKEQAESTRGPHKPLASRYKGMSPEELVAFKDAQGIQIKEIEKMKSEEKRINDDWDKLMNAHARTAFMYQCEQEQRKAEIKKKIAEENLRLAKQQKSRQELERREVYDNNASAEFFEQFNKGTR